MTSEGGIDSISTTAEIGEPNVEEERDSSRRFKGTWIFFQELTQQAVVASVSESTKRVSRKSHECKLLFNRLVRHNVHERRLLDRT